MTPSSWEMRKIIDKRNCITLKTFSTSKETISRVKRQPTGLEKVSWSYSMDK
jgi:hypothetical protein